jgi:hypothetical protein
MTTLRDLMQQTLQHDHADMVRLTCKARSHGRTMRRRRRALTACSCLLLVAGVVGGAASGQLKRDPEDRTQVADTPGSVPSRDGLEALESAIAEVAPNITIADVTELITSIDQDGKYSKAGLTVRRVGADAGSHVSLTYFPFDPPASPRQLCNEASSDLTCDVDALPDGSFLLTYQLHAGQGGNKSWVYDAVRYVGGYAYGIDVTAAVNRQDTYLDPDPLLTKDQVIDIMSQPVWTKVSPL